MPAESPHMLVRSHLTALTEFVTANGIRFACRRFGAETGTLQHFRGGMDHWDPAGNRRPGRKPSSHPVQQHRSGKLERRDARHGGSAGR
jgi:hypothetical protein